jgi:hypothetical protein
MGGRVRERPRLVAALVLVFVLIAGAGVLVGMAIGGDDPKVPAATQARLDRAERAAGELKATRAEADRNRQAAAGADRRARALRARNRRLRSALTRTRRALRRARR